MEAMGSEGAKIRTTEPPPDGLCVLTATVIFRTQHVDVLDDWARSFFR